MKAMFEGKPVAQPLKPATAPDNSNQKQKRGEGKKTEAPTVEKQEEVKGNKP